MSDKILFGYLSVFLAAVSLTPYFLSVLAGKTKPHIFTWLIWTLVCGITAAAQFAGHAGYGAWPTALTTAFSFAITILAFKYGERTITKSDCITLVVALCAIPLWYYTKTPLWAAIIATLIDAVATYPTFRKSYMKPWEEMMLLYIVGDIKHIASFFAMDEYSVTTLIYPIVTFIVNTAMISMLIWRRRQIR